MRARAGLHPPPRPRCVGLEHAGEDLREGAVDAVAVRLEAGITALVQLDTQSCLGGHVGELPAQIGVELVAVRIAPCELAQERAKGTRARERPGVHGGVALDEAARAEPGAELVGRRDVVLLPDRDLGVDEVLHEIERRRRRSAPGGLEPGSISARHR
jgi:hypothetical protein